MTDDELAAGMLVNLPRIRAQRIMDAASAFATANSPIEKSIALMETAGVHTSTIKRTVLEAWTDEAKAAHLKGSQ